MATCARCGQESAGQFCGNCGAPLGGAPGGPQGGGGQAGNGGPGGAPPWASSGLVPPWQQHQAQTTTTLPPPGGGAPPGGPSAPGGGPSGSGSQPYVPPNAASGGPGGQVSWAERVFRGRPLHYPTTLYWITRACMRNPRGPMMAFFTTWFNVYLGLVLAAVGGVTGVIAGWLGGLMNAAQFIGDTGVGQFMPNAALNVSGALGAALGLLVGVIAGFLAGILWSPLLIYGVTEDIVPVIGWVIGQIVSGIVIGWLYTLIHNMFEGTIMRWKGARQLSRRENELIMPIVREMAHRLGMHGVPRVLMNESRDVNAYAGARHIVLNQGLLDEFEYDPEVLSGVIAHELTHWHNADPVSNAFVRGVAFPIYVMYTFCEWVRKALGPVLGPLFMLLFIWLIWPLYFIMRAMIAPAHATDTRPAEIIADQGAVKAGQRVGMRRALVRIKHAIDGGLSGWDEAMCRTHPPTELRLERMEEPGKSYPLPDPDGPTSSVAAAGAGGGSLMRD